MGAMLWVSKHEQQHRGHGPLLQDDPIGDIA